MKLMIYPTPQTLVEVEAEQTTHAELVIHEMNVRKWVTPPAIDKSAAEKPKPFLSAPIGKVWAVSHIGTGQVICKGLLTRDLALATVQMLTANGMKFGKGWKMPAALDIYQAGACTMTDTYFAQFYETGGDILTIA